MARWLTSRSSRRELSDNKEPALSGKRSPNSCILMLSRTCSLSRISSLNNLSTFSLCHLRKTRVFCFRNGSGNPPNLSRAKKSFLSLCERMGISFSLSYSPFTKDFHFLYSWRESQYFLLQSKKYLNYFCFKAKNNN